MSTVIYYLLYLKKNFVGDGGDKDRLVVLGRDKVSGDGHLRGALHDGNLLSTLLGSLGGGRVGASSCKEILLASARLHMFNTNIDALLHIAATYLLVDDDTEGTGGNIEDDTGLSMVEAVGHSLLAGGIGLDVNIVTHLVGFHVGAQVNHAMLAEIAREHMASASTLSVRVRHLPRVGLFLGT